MFYPVSCSSVMCLECKDRKLNKAVNCYQFYMVSNGLKRRMLLMVYSVLLIYGVTMDFQPQSNCTLLFLLSFFQNQINLTTFMIIRSQCLSLTACLFCFLIIVHSYNCMLMHNAEFNKFMLCYVMLRLISVCMSDKETEI